MKISEIIEKLKQAKKSCGDLEVEILHYDDNDENVREVLPIYFVYYEGNFGQEDKLLIQNLP